MFSSRRGDVVQPLSHFRHQGIRRRQHPRHVLGHGVTRFEMLQATLDRTLHRVRAAPDLARDGVDFTGRARRLFCELAHLIGDHREAAALLAGARRLDRGIECQQIGLLRDLPHLARHARNRSRRFDKLTHRARHLPHRRFHLPHFAHQLLQAVLTFTRTGQAVVRTLAHRGRAVGNMGDAVAHRIDRCRGAHRTVVLSMRALRQIGCSACQTLCCRRHRAGRLSHLRHQRTDGAHHAIERARSATDLVIAATVQTAPQIAATLRNLGQTGGQMRQRQGDETTNEEEHETQHGQRHQQRKKDAVVAKLGDGRIGLVQRHAHAYHA